MISRIALMGAGSLGTTLGAFLSKAGYDIILVDAYKAHVDVLNETGAHIIGAIDEVIPVKACYADAMEGTFDLFIYMAKQTYNDVAIPQMLAHSHDKTIIVTCQNGLPEPGVAKYFPKERVMGAPIAWGGIFQGPGCTYLTVAPDKMFCTIGTYTGEHTSQLEEVAKILSAGNAVTVSDNLMGLRWCKLTLNACFSGVSTITGCNFGEIIQDPELMRLVAYIGRECVLTAKAGGVKMEPYHFGGEEYHFEEFYDFPGDDPDMKVITDAAVGYLMPAAPTIASMLQDIKRDLRCEVDGITGAVCDAGDAGGIDTPVNDQLRDMIKKIEAGKMPYERANAKLIKF
ncbi:ketopantoate reductase family protein [Papillibacter cinnamivorans]|uniref:ketopantoate reductase family protein n=1 Tax=Papillibacter cinnamivorans TaxID=100176 RepID=UPI0013564D2C|nr:2-dehydropantoate 2-reductase [Papillibacter cinnamivorans]